ncbi:MAG: hypothetical protein R3B95_07800 [Nitrospirales bacterium]|nr:hypothetical protein [Nitrospirales bacterium]
MRTLKPDCSLTYESPSTALANRRAGFVDQEIERLKKVHADSTNFTRWAATVGRPIGRGGNDAKTYSYCCV